MLFDLRERIRVQSKLPQLPHGWHREMALRPAGGQSFSGDFVVAARTNNGRTMEVVLTDVSGKDGNGVPGVYPPLNGNSSVDEPTGINAIRVVLLGGFPPVTAGNPRPYSMPPFAQSLDDADVAAVVSYIRHAWGNRASPVLERDVGRYRQTPVD